MTLGHLIAKRKVDGASLVGLRTFEIGSSSVARSVPPYVAGAFPLAGVVSQRTSWIEKSFISFGFSAGVVAAVLVLASKVIQIFATSTGFLSSRIT